MAAMEELAFAVDMEQHLADSVGMSHSLRVVVPAMGVLAVEVPAVVAETKRNFVTTNSMGTMYLLWVVLPAMGVPAVEVPATVIETERNFVTANSVRSSYSL